MSLLLALRDILQCRAITLDFGAKQTLEAGWTSNTNRDYRQRLICSRGCDILVFQNVGMTR